MYFSSSNLVPLAGPSRGHRGGVVPSELHLAALCPAHLQTQRFLRSGFARRAFARPNLSLPDRVHGGREPEGDLLVRSRVEPAG